MAFVILMECLLLSRFLARKWFNKRIYATALLTNAVSGIVGFTISMLMNGGWWLVVWFPWVSSNEVHLSGSSPQYILELCIYYLCAFILTLIIETIINWLLLRKKYPAKNIIKYTFVVNLISYLIGSAVLYSYSFS